MKIYDPLKITFPCFIQPKLNGVYAELEPGGIFVSRTGKFFPAVQEAQPGITNSTDYSLKGEFYVHGWPLQKIISAVMPKKPNELSSQIPYYVYDTSSEDLPQYIRFQQIPANFPKVTTVLIRNHSEGDYYYRQFLSQGYEGAVYRPYTFGELLKRKPFKDAEFLCTGVVEGIGKRRGHVGKFQLKTPEGKSFNCGGGRVSYKELAKLLVDPPIGKMITVRYQHTSEDGIPQCAQFIAVRDYE